MTEPPFPVARSLKTNPNTRPKDDSGLFRTLLKVGGRTIKLMTLMAMGPYERPKGVWMPSVLY